MTRPPPPAGSYRRAGAGLEFDRASFFTDAVYAIAMTLLVVELHVPDLAGTAAPAALRRAVLDEGWAISGLEVVLFRMAVRRGHMRFALSPELERFGYLAAGTPILMMALSIPLAYLSPTLALLSWLLMIPAGHLIDRHAPPGARDL